MQRLNLGSDCLANAMTGADAASDKLLEGDRFSDGLFFTVLTKIYDSELDELAVKIIDKQGALTLLFAP